LSSVFAPDENREIPRIRPSPPAHESGSTYLRKIWAFSPTRLGKCPGSGAARQRSHMLKIHQRLGLITTIPLLATVITGSQAGGKTTSSGSRDLHAALGSVTTGLPSHDRLFFDLRAQSAGTTTRGPSAFIRP
jgi:hypothetical protein